MEIPLRCYFFDFHTQPAIPDVGANFEPELVAKRLKDCGVGYVVFPARCNMGMAYYNTKIGIRHTSLQYDLFGRLVEACGKEGIGLGAYINAGLSHEEALAHRDWTIVTPEGYAYKPDRMGNFFRNMCYNTGYADHLIAMAEEVARNYPLAGFFFDCMGAQPCVGGECVKEMKKLGMDWNDPVDQREFAQQSIYRMCDRLSKKIRAIKPDLQLFFNGVPYAQQQTRGTYQELEVLPTGGWGYDCLPVMGRYARTLPAPAVNMTGRFHRSWGEFGGIRTEPSLKYDCLHGIGLGLRTNIGDHFHPRGDFNHDVFKLVEKIYSELRQLDPWVEGAEGVAEVGLVVPQPGFITSELEKHTQALFVTYGAARMLAELNCQFDVITSDQKWKKYKVLVLPDRVMLDADVRAKVEAHLARGGAILSSGFSGMDAEDGKFVLDDWGVDFAGKDTHDPAYIAVAEAARKGLPEMPLCVYEGGVQLSARKGTEELAAEIAPYFDKHWDGEHHFFYLPPDKATGRPAVTKKGKVVHIAHLAFHAYYEQSYPSMKKLVGNLLEMLLPQPMLKMEKFPSFGKALLTRQDNRFMAHLLAYVPERRGQVDMIEEPIELRGVEVGLRCDGFTPKKAYLAPSGEELKLRTEDGYAKATVPTMSGSTVVVFEK